VERSCSSPSIVEVDVIREGTMDLGMFATVFATIFVAELGDKTQLATLLYAADASHSKAVVFLASASALVLTSLLGVVAGGLVADHVDPRLLSWIAGLGFIAVGIWTLMRA
jgi:putative Ca2+/H+ antiporter (TMEM165/GDT1 family)